MSMHDHLYLELVDPLRLFFQFCGSQRPIKYRVPKNDLNSYEPVRYILKWIQSSRYYETLRITAVTMCTPHNRLLKFTSNLRFGHPQKNLLYSLISIFDHLDVVHSFGNL